MRNGTLEDWHELLVRVVEENVALDCDLLEVFEVTQSFENLAEIVVGNAVVLEFDPGKELWVEPKSVLQ